MKLRLQFFHFSFPFYHLFYYLCTHDTTKETTFGDDAGRVESSCRQSWYACFAVKAGCSVVVCEACEEHRRDDKSVEAEQRATV